MANPLAKTSMKQCIILYYSRTGTTKKVAEALAKALDTDLEEVIDTKNRAGALGYLSAGKDASLKKLTQLKPLQANLKNYQLVIVGTPVWSWTISTPIRTLLSEQKNNLHKTAFFCTRGGSDTKSIFEEMIQISGCSPLATMQLLTKEVVQDNFEQQLLKFIDEIKMTMPIL